MVFYLNPRYNYSANGSHEAWNPSERLLVLPQKPTAFCTAY